MPRDQRSFMTFPIDMHRHPKVMRLPVEVRWTFFEMNGEACLARNDGRFSSADAEFMWPVEHLDALLNSHPSRPLIVRDGDFYVIRDFDEHQLTNAERARLAEVSRANGAKGGRPRKSETQQKPSQVSKEPRGNPAEPGAKQSQSQSQSQMTTTYVSESQSLDNRASESTDEQSAEPYKSTLAAQYGIDVEKVGRHLDDKLGLMLAPPDVVNVSMWILNKIPQPPRAPTRYIIGSIDKSPAEVQQYIHESALI